MKILLFLAILIYTSAFSQGNFNLEWQTPSGMYFYGICSFEKNNNVFEIATHDNSSNSIKIYDGNTHIVKYTIPFNPSLDTSYPVLPNVIIEYGTDLPKKADFNNDGIYDYYLTKNYVFTSLKIVNSANNTIIKEMTFPSLPGSASRNFNLLDIDGDGYTELLINEYYFNGTTTIGTLFIYSTPALSVAVNENNTTIPNYELKQNYPNPFNPSTTIEYSINKTANVLIKIYDVTGKEIQSLAKGVQSSGAYKVNLTSENLSSGTYFYQILVDGNSDAKKMVVIK